MIRTSHLPIDTRVLAIGKFAGYPEFLRPDGGGEALEAFDEWIEHGNMGAHERWGRQWSSTFAMGAAQGFLWSTPHEQSFLCGVIAPSRDAVGRDYPLAISARFPWSLVGRAPHVAPLAFGEFLDGAYRVIDEARTVPMSLDDLTRRLHAVAAATADDVFRAETEYATWSHGTPLELGWSAVFPNQHPLEGAARALETITAALAPLRGRESPDTSLVLRLPLGIGGVAAAVLWLDVVRRICRWSRTVPSAFWGLDDGVLLLPLGRPPASTFGEMWRPDPSNENVCDVTCVDDGRVSGIGRVFGGAPRETPMIAFLDALGR